MTLRPEATASWRVAKPTEEEAPQSCEGVRETEGNEGEAYEKSFACWFWVDGWIGKFEEVLRVETVCCG